MQVTHIYTHRAYWSGLPFSSPGNLPDPEIEPRSPALWTDTLPSDPLGKTIYETKNHYINHQYMCSEQS